MANTVPLLCPHCQQFLVSVKFSRHNCLVCDNYHCYLFRERQVIISCDGDEPEVRRRPPTSEHVFRVNYEVSKELYRENYQYARSLGIPSVSARDYRNKSREEIEKAAAAMTH